MTTLASEKTGGVGHPSFVGILAARVPVVVPLGLYSVALFANVLLTLPAMSQSSPQWVWHLGLAAGALFAVAVPFMLWAYFVVAIYVSLVLLGQDVRPSNLARIISAAFLFAAAGKLIETALVLAGRVEFAAWPYIVLAIGGLVVSGYGMHRDLDVPVEDAFLSSAIALFVLELLFHLLPLAMNVGAVVAPT